MATYNGYLSPSAIWPQTPPAGLSVSVFKVDRTDRTPALIADGVLFGSKDFNNTPTYPVGVGVSGKYMPSFVDDYYDRVHVIPASIALGNLVSNKESPFAVWNAWRVPRTLTASLQTGADGLALVGFPTAPYEYGALQYSNYTLQASTEGPPTILATYKFQFDNAEESLLLVTGRRILVFPYRPNWKNGMTETLEWKTDVLRAYNGSEQRRSLRLYPRRGFEYDFLATKRDAQRLETLLWGWGYRDFALPVWTDITKITSAVNEGEQWLPCDTVDRGFRINDFIVVYGNTEEYEAAQISSIADDGIGTLYPLQFSWGVGAKVLPAIVAHLPTTTPLQRHTDNVVSGRVRFLGDPKSTYTFLPDDITPVTYDGLEVLTTKTNWKDAISNDFTWEFLTADTGVGLIGHYKKETYPRIVRPFQWLLKTKAEIRAFRSFIGRTMGQAKAIWVPSWHDDFWLHKRIELSDTSITVVGLEFADLVGLDTTRDRLRLVLRDGTTYYRRILNVTPDGENTVFGLDSGFGRVIETTEMRSINFLLKCRFATDKIDIPWQTTTVATPRIVLTSVKD